MLAPVPYQVPAGEEKERSGEVKSHLHAGGTSRTIPGEIKTPVSEDERGGESNIPSPHRKKRDAPEDVKAEASKRGKESLSGGPYSGGDIVTQRPQGGQPLTKP